MIRLNYPKEARADRFVREDGWTVQPYYKHCAVWCGYVKIYSLSDYEGNIFYIGCTTSTLKVRLSHHLSITNASVLSNVAKANKIAELDRKVNINLIEQYYTTAPCRRDAQKKFLDKELAQITKHIQLGFKLFNREAKLTEQSEAA